MEKLERYLLKGKHFCEKNKGLLTTIGAIIGVGVTIYLTSKATLKVERVLNEVHTPDEVKTVKKTVVKEIAKPAISTALTIFCIVLTYKFGKQTEAGLLSIIAGSSALMNEYRKNLVDSGVMSPDEEVDCYQKALNKIQPKDIPENPSTLKNENYDNYKLYKEELTGIYFWAKPEDILHAEIHLKDGIAYKDYADFWTWLNDITCSMDKDAREEALKPFKNGALNCGWSSVGWGSEEKYGYRYVEIGQKEMTDEATGADYTLIYYPFAPHTDYEDIDLCDESEYTVYRLLPSKR